MKIEDYFIAVPEDSGENWWVCWTGDYGNNSWNVTTNHIHGSDVPDAIGRPDECARLIAKLLSWYCSSEKNSRIIDSIK